MEPQRPPPSPMDASAPHDNADPRDFSFDMMAYPTANPSWQGSILLHDTKVAEMGFSFPYDAPYTGSVAAELERGFNPEFCHASIFTDNAADLATMRAACQLQLESYVDTLLSQIDNFYPWAKATVDLDVLAELKAAGRSYDALIRLLKEIPESTPWSDKGPTVGTFKDGRMQWMTPTLRMVWNLEAGYPIMIRAIVDAIDNSKE